MKNKPSLSMRKFIQAGLLGGIIATIINVILYFIGNAMNGNPMQVDPPGPPPLQALPVYAVIMFSIVPGLIAGLLYGILKRFTSRARVIFLILAVIIFAVFLAGPLEAAQGAVTLWILQIMHVGTAAPVIAMLLKADK